MRISDWSSDVCSSDLEADGGIGIRPLGKDEGHGREAQHIVDDGRLAEQSLQCGKRRLGAHLPALALDAVEQRGFLSAHISASADAHLQRERRDAVGRQPDGRLHRIYRKGIFAADVDIAMRRADGMGRSEEHTSELQSLMRISYAVFCLKKKNNRKIQ